MFVTRRSRRRNAVLAAIGLGLAGAATASIASGSPPCWAKQGTCAKTKTTTTATTTTTPAPQPPPTTTTTTTGGRTLVFDDEFNGTALDTTQWNRYYSAGNGGNGLRRPGAITLDGSGHLVVTASMISGLLVSGGMANNHSYTYGYYEFRVLTEPDPTGTMSGVVLTWPQSGNWPTEGELDIYETLHAINTRNPFYSFVHYSSSNRQYYFIHPADAAQWHTIAMDWTASAIKLYRDGVLVWTLTDAAAIPDVAHHLSIQLDAMATRTLTQPVRMYVDYVHIWK
jgi:beta-glucanase (GH16 family)